MALYDAFVVFGAAITDFNGVVVEDLVEFVLSTFLKISIKVKIIDVLCFTKLVLDEDTNEKNDDFRVFGCKIGVFDLEPANSFLVIEGQMCILSNTINLCCFSVFSTDQF